MKHYQFYVPDERSANNTLQQMMPHITSIIHAHRLAGRNVLVHCYAGMHRAPTVVAQYLQRYEGHTVDSAVKHIRSARPIAFIDGNTFDLKYYY
jgi:protein-tyrosine phosphatase